MPIINALLRRAYVAITEMSWGGIAVVGLSHAVLSYILLAIVGEAGLTGGS